MSNIKFSAKPELVYDTLIKSNKIYENFEDKKHLKDVVYKVCESVSDYHFNSLLNKIEEALKEETPVNPDAEAEKQHKKEVDAKWKIFRQDMLKGTNKPEIKLDGEVQNPIAVEIPQDNDLFSKEYEIIRNDFENNSKPQTFFEGITQFFIFLQDSDLISIDPYIKDNFSNLNKKIIIDNFLNLSNKHKNSLVYLLRFIYDNKLSLKDLLLTFLVLPEEYTEIFQEFNKEKTKYPDEYDYLENLILNTNLSNASSLYNFLKCYSETLFEYKRFGENSNFNYLKRYFNLLTSDLFKDTNIASQYAKLSIDDKEIFFEKIDAYISDNNLSLNSKLIKSNILRFFETPNKETFEFNDDDTYQTHQDRQVKQDVEDFLVSTNEYNINFIKYFNNEIKNNNEALQFFNKFPTRLKNIVYKEELAPYFISALYFLLKLIYKKDTKANIEDIKIFNVFKNFTKDYELDRNNKFISLEDSKLLANKVFIYLVIQEEYNNKDVLNFVKNLPNKDIEEFINEYSSKDSNEAYAKINNKYLQSLNVNKELLNDFNELSIDDQNKFLSSDLNLHHPKILELHKALQRIRHLTYDSANDVDYNESLIFVFEEYIDDITNNIPETLTVLTLCNSKLKSLDVNEYIVITSKYFPDKILEWSGMLLGKMVSTIDNLVSKILEENSKYLSSIKDKYISLNELFRTNTDTSNLSLFKNISYLHKIEDSFKNIPMLQKLKINKIRKQNLNLLDTLPNDNTLLDKINNLASKELTDTTLETEFPEVYNALNFMNSFFNIIINNTDNINNTKEFTFDNNLENVDLDNNKYTNILVNTKDVIIKDLDINLKNDSNVEIPESKINTLNNNVSTVLNKKNKIFYSNFINYLQKNTHFKVEDKASEKVFESLIPIYNNVVENIKTKINNSIRDLKTIYVRKALFSNLEDNLNNLIQKDSNEFRNFANFYSKNYPKENLTDNQLINKALTKTKSLLTSLNINKEQVKKEKSSVSSRLKNLFKQKIERLQSLSSENSMNDELLKEIETQISNLKLVDASLQDMITELESVEQYLANINDFINKFFEETKFGEELKNKVSILQLLSMRKEFTDENRVNEQADLIIDNLQIDLTNDKFYQFK